MGKGKIMFLCFKRKRELEELKLKEQEFTNKLLVKIAQTLYRIERLLQPDNTARSIQFYIIKNGLKERVTNMFLKVTENLPLSVTIVDAKGNAAKVDGAPQWAVTDGSLATLTVAEDGMSATVSPVGAVGSLKVQVSADADLGEGVVTLLGELDLELLAGDAVSVTLVAGEPVAQ